MNRILALTTLITLAACGSSSGSSAPSGGASTAPPPAKTSRTGSSGSKTTRTATTKTVKTVASNTPPACRAADLALSFLGQQGATGHGELGFALRNTSSASCHTYGYPGIQFLDQAGNPLPTTPQHTTHDLFGDAPLVALTLVPGATASFRLGVTHGITSTAGCTTAYGLQVIPPDDTATLRVAISGGAYECRTATVSPLRPGTSAYGS